MNPVLITCHGYTGYPEEMAPLGQFFEKQGFEWVNLCLPGHNSTPEELKETSWKMWTNYVDGEVEKYTNTGRDVVFAGLSLGGAMTLYALEHHPELKAGISLAAPTVILTGFNRALTWIPFLNFWITKSETDSLDVVDGLDEVHRDYKRHHTKSVKQLNSFVNYVRENLGKISQPLFILHGDADRVIPVKAADVIEDSIASQIFHKQIVHAGHVLTREKQREKWFQDSLEFVIKVLDNEP